MPKKYHLIPKPTPARFATLAPFGIIEGDGCLGCPSCIKKQCVYSVYDKRAFDSSQLLDTADSLCKNCFRCLQGCYGRILAKSKNPEFWSMGDEYWTPEIIAINQSQAETGKIPVSGGGYGGPFSGEGFDSFWTDMSEIVRPTRDGIHGREYISTLVELGRTLAQVVPRPTSHRVEPGASPFPKRVATSIPIIFDLMAIEEPPANVRLAWAQAAGATNTLLIMKAEHFTEALWPLASHLVPLLPLGPLGKFTPAIRRVPMVQVALTAGILERIQEIKEINPQVTVAIRIPLTPRGEEEAAMLAQAGAEVLHLLADEKGREQKSPSPRFIKDLIRSVHLRLVNEKQRDRLSLIFGGGIATAEHVAKAILCGADAVSIDRPLLFALECRLCRRCLRGAGCPVEIEKIDPDWGRQRLVNLITAWHAQLLEVLGAMGLRDVRRLRGEVGRAIFKEDIEKETFGQMFGAAAEKSNSSEENKGDPEGSQYGLAS